MNALLLGYYGARNLGDDMMLTCILNWLSIQDINTTVVSENPEETRKRFRIEAIRNATFLGEWAWFDNLFRGGTFRLMEAIKNHDVLLVGGGDLIRDDQGWRTFWYTIEKLVYAHLCGTPVCLVNIGIENPVTKTGRFILKWVLGNCRQIIVRDKRSYEVCCKFICEHKTTLVNDIAINLPNVLSRIEKNEISNTSQYEIPYFTVCLRGEPNAFGTYPFTEEQIINFAAGLDHIVHRYGMKLVFLPFQEHPTKGDNTIHEKIVTFMSNKNMTTIRAWTSNMADVLNCIQGAQFVIGMRLHAVVMAVALNKSCVVMPYDTKLREFISSAGIRATLEVTETFEKQKIINCLEGLLSITPQYTLNNLNNWNDLAIKVQHSKGSYS